MAEDLLGALLASLETLTGRADRIDPPQRPDPETEES
jgi:hypothetical protein